MAVTCPCSSQEPDRACSRRPTARWPVGTNHVQGNDRTKWRTGLPAYERVAYADVYPGVDLVYYGNQQQLEYDFVVAPGASHDAIDLAFSGQTGLSIDDAGQLVIATTRGAVVQRAPLVYQEDAEGSHQPVDGGYVIRGDGHVGFRVGSYDARRPLVIDPVLGYSTYLGGSGGDERRASRLTGQAMCTLPAVPGRSTFHNRISHNRHTAAATTTPTS